ncbi:DUF5076 domain-containing protein [Parvularcula maris]|uniref:DUF5076 domain-containing protein n=1 Tax=Parvularcula maris TaxID=2965077 RepID=A0A9X2RJJ4_9PROT|nr:DUF5076 domain-containing protein [Parvularcula maris]MCQ8184803.1 DUF5076 domain-containing protein [Parvularcula maris]
MQQPSTVLPIPEAIAHPADGLELFRVWRSTEATYVGWFVGDEWTSTNFAQITADFARELMNLQSRDDAVQNSDIVALALGDVHEPQADFSGRYGGTASTRPNDVAEHMLPIPVPADEIEDVYEVARGWADGKRLQVSLREDILMDHNRAAWIILQLIQHAANALQQRDGRDFDDLVEEISAQVRNLGT